LLQRSRGAAFPRRALSSLFLASIRNAQAQFGEYKNDNV
jgi:hypothetical protein